MFMIRKSWWTTCLVAVIALLAASNTAKAEDAKIADLEIENIDSVLTVRFGIAKCFTSDLEEAILSGVKTSFRIHVVLQEDSWSPFFTEIMRVEIKHSVRYDVLNGTFTVKQSEHPGIKLTTKDFDQAKRWMSEVKDLRIIPVWQLDDDDDYEIRVKAELSKVTLPLSLRYVFYFVSFWDFETDWKYKRVRF